MRDNESLRTLSVSWRELGGAHVAALAEALRGNTALQELRLDSERDLTDVSRAELAAMLQENTALRSLCLRATPTAWWRLATRCAPTPR